MTAYRPSRWDDMPGPYRKAYYMTLASGSEWFRFVLNDDLAPDHPARDPNLPPSGWRHGDMTPIDYTKPTDNRPADPAANVKQTWPRD